MAKFLKIYLLIVFTLFLFLPAFSVNAITLVEGLDCAKTSLDPSLQTCTLNDFIRIAVNLSQIILGLTGSLALLAFIYGGFVFLLSGGSAQNVEKGKGILKAAVIGLVIVFASYTIIQFVLTQAGLIDETTGKFKNPEFNKSDNWNTPPPATVP